MTQNLMRALCNTNNTNSLQKSILVRVSVRFELVRVRGIGVDYYTLLHFFYFFKFEVFFMLTMTYKCSTQVKVYFKEGARTQKK